jgi:hypothetical protein
MKSPHHVWIGMLLLQAFVLSGGVAHADEGMWLLNDLPGRLLMERYKFTPSEDWSKHLMLSSVRFSSGGSASFVSSNGLVLTNHHVAADTLNKLSTADKNYYESGFTALTPDQEIKAPDLELNQLVSIEDVTKQVNDAVEPGVSANEAYKARLAAMEKIEKQSMDETGLRSDVVTLYGGAKYHLYRYKKYTDVRLVWAPEAGAAQFGGDPDNFEYPRYCLDVTLVRAYENDKPAKTEHFLKWSKAGAADGELVFVCGHPGNTQRRTTLAALKGLRDRQLPFQLNYFCRTEIALQQFASDSPEHQRRAKKDLTSVQNSRKAMTGMLQGLQTPEFIQRKEHAEQTLRDKLQAKPGLRKFDDAWRQIADLQSRKAALVGRIPEFRSRYYDIAKHLVLMATEDQKPSEKRLREYRDSARASLELQLFSPAPIHNDLEVAKLANELALFAERWGGDDAMVVKMLAGKNPRERAAELINGSTLNKVEFRRQLAKRGAAEIDSSSDPLLRFFQAIEPDYRQLRETQDELDEIQRQAYTKIDEANVALNGTSGYPDATFTLRLAFGKVAGYTEEGRAIAPWTTIGGAFQHESVHETKEPWQLPQTWHNARNQIDGSTPLNFVCTADIIGGNSGSPVVNRAGELVGVIFDSNIQGLTASYFYDDQVARAISVHSSAIRESLRDIYHANELADQLGK